jgi:D-3-phosphoglycerate dehydrogenase
VDLSTIPILKILHLEYDQYPAVVISQLSESNEIVRFECNTQKELVVFLCKNSFDAIFTRLGLMIDEEVLNLQPRLKYIVTPTTGLNHIDTDLTATRGIYVISLKGEVDFLKSIKSTAEHTWALLLAVTRNIIAAHNAVLQYECWERKPFEAGETDGKTIGIIGFGRLGKIVAGYAKAFGMTVLINDANQAEMDNAQEGIIPVKLDELLGHSDYVVLLISWSRENEEFFNRSMFEKMKAGAFFINTSRGELVDQDALLHFLQNGRLGGAALDVLKGDSSWESRAQGGKELLLYAKNHQNLMITPHMGGYGTTSIEKTRSFITQKFIRLSNNNDS